MPTNSSDMLVLNPEFRTVLVKGKIAIVLGGTTVAFVSGDDSLNLLGELLRLLANRVTTRDVTEKISPDERAPARSLIRMLVECGALMRNPEQPFERSSRAARFVLRNYPHLHRSSSPGTAIWRRRNLNYSVFCPSSLEQYVRDSARSMPALDIKTVDDPMRPNEHEAIFERRDLNLDSARVVMDFLSCRATERVYVEVRVASQPVVSEVDKPFVADLVMLNIYLHSLGFSQLTRNQNQQSRAIEFQDEFSPALDGSFLPIQLPRGPAQECVQIDRRRTQLEEISRIALGCQQSTKRGRRTTPSAGGLFSVGLLSVDLDTRNSASPNVHYFSPIYGALIRKSSQETPDQLTQALEARGDACILVMFSNLGVLRSRYDNRASSLGECDFGFAVEFALAGLRAFGLGVEIVSRDASTQLSTWVDQHVSPLEVGAIECLLVECGDPSGQRSRSSSLFDDWIHEEHDESTLKAIASRHSVRAFSRSQIPSYALQRIEHAASACYEEVTRTGRINRKITITRINRTYDGVCSQAESWDLSNRGGRVRQVLARPDALSMIVQQADLAQADAIYLLTVHKVEGCTDRTQNSERMSRTICGRIFSAMWIEAEKHQVVGAPSGRIDKDFVSTEVLIPDHSLTSELALCLGVPFPDY